MATTVPADTVFSASTNTFPGWNNPDPSSYAWTLPNTSHWYNIGQNVSQGVFSFVANTLLQLIAWVLHIAIYVSSYFSDPKGITDPVVHAAAGVFRGAYQTVFMKLLPVLVMLFVAYIAWKYVVAHHAKILSGIISTLAATALIGLFFFDFGQTFNTIDSFGQLVTNTAASAVASAAGTNVGSEYDTLWQNYVLFPWEYGQFGQFSGTLSNFNVNSTYINNPSYTYQPDPTSSNSNPGEVPIPSTINGQPANWVTLFLSTTNSRGRSDLENIITKNQNIFATGSSLSTNAVTSANQYVMIPFLVIELLLLIVPVIFLVYVGFQLFVRELLFIVTIMMGMVTVPMAFVPEIGWRVTANWIREAVGHQVERLGNAVYAALLFLVCSLITQSVPDSEFGMMGAFLVDALLFAAALIYKQKVFSIAVNPLSDSVRGVDQNHRMTMDEYIQQKHAEEHGGKSRTLRGATIGKTGKLSEHFAHTLEYEEQHHPALPASHRATDTLHVAADEPSHVAGHVRKPVGGHLADSFNENDGVTKRQKFARNAKDFRQALGNAIKQHIEDVSNPGPPKTHEEKVREREQRARGLEAKLHRHSVKALHRSVSALLSKPKMQDGLDHPNDPPDAPPGAGPADVGNGDEKQRKVMVSHDGQLQQGVVFDREGRDIAIEPPSVARPRRGEAEVTTPSLSEGFNVPVQDSLDNSATEQPSHQVHATLPAPVPVDEKPGQVTFATGFTSEEQAEPEPEPVPDQGQLSGEKSVSDTGENAASTSPPERPTTQNDTHGQVASQDASQPNSEATAPVSTRQSNPVQPHPLPANVTRLQDEREHRTEVEGRRREQRSQRRQAPQGRRVARMRVNDPRPRGPEL